MSELGEYFTQFRGFQTSVRAFYITLYQYGNFFITLRNEYKVEHYAFEFRERREIFRVNIELCQ
jgi:hypothetical protein